MDDAQVSEREKDFANLRDDFMRRWFAIAVSLGFAATVVEMRWVKAGDAPTPTEWEHLWRLGAALIATLLSWEGYFISIAKKRLYDFWRYLIDVFLVFVYLFLLLTSKFPHFWLGLHALTFFIYMIWDFLTAWWYRRWYALEGTPLWRVYWNGITASRGVDPGSIITVVWTLYFLALWHMSSYKFPYDTAVFAIFVLVGLASYRFNKGRFRGDLAFTYLTPAATILALGMIILVTQFIDQRI